MGKYVAMRKGSKLTPRQRRKAVAALRLGSAIRWTKSLAERFWEKVDRGGANECWLWTASLNAAGYGQLYRGGRPIVASRISWELANGPIPAGAFVLHRCDTPACVNPRHLFLGTQTDNMKDMVKKGRSPGGAHGSEPRGTDHWRAKLTPQRVRAVRRRFNAGESAKQIADRFGVDRMTIKAVLSGKTWRHVK